jgi:hypothetical protein
MLKEAKKWVQTLEATLTELAKEFNKPIEELDAQFEEWYDNGGSDFDLGGPYSSPEAFASEYRADHKEEAESEAYEEVYKKIRAFAASRDYELSDSEIECIIEEAEEDGDSVLDCSDEALAELTKDWLDWLIDHQE